MPTVVRVDPSNVMRTAANAPPYGLPALFAVAGSTIGLFNNALGTLPATAYTDVSGGTACPINAPVTLPPLAIAQSTTGSQGQFGFWLVPGLYYYTITTPDGQNYGPFPIEASGSNSDWLALTNAPVADVRAFGAVGDGVTDDTDAIQRAIASLPSSAGTTFYYSAGGGTVLFTPGLYKASIVIPSGVVLQATGPGAAIVAKAPSSVVVATAPGAFWFGISGLDIQINQQAGTVGLDINSTSQGYVRNVCIGGGAGMTDGIGLRLRGTSTAQSAYVHFENILVDIGPATALWVEGYNATTDPAQAKAPTWCTFTNCRFTNSRVDYPVVRVVAWTDTMFMNNINIAGGAAIGMVFNSGDPTNDVDVSGWIIKDIVFEGITTTCIQFANCSYITIDGFNNLSSTANNWTSTSGTLGLTVTKIFKSPAAQHPSWYSTSPFQLGETDRPTGFRLPPFPTTLGNGANNNVDATNKANLLIIGPTGAFSITGFAGGGHGDILKVTSSVNQVCTIPHNSGSSAAGNRISTLTGSPVVSGANFFCFELQYDGINAIWLLRNYNG